MMLTQYYSMWTFSDVSEAEILSPRNPVMTKEQQLVKGFKIMPCEYGKDDYNRSVPLPQPMLTDIVGPRICSMGTHENGDGFIFSENVKDILLPHLPTNSVLVPFREGVNALTNEKITLDYYALFVPFTNDIADFIDFKQSEFILYEGATNISNGKTKKKLVGFNETDFRNWADNYFEEVIMKKNWAGVFIDKLVLKDGAPKLFSLNPSFWFFRGMMIHEEIINEMRLKKITGLSANRVNAFICKC